ncbi:SAM-dependent methyltransferase [Kineosporia rhizophila]|nr:N-6 DNA methylase [Kineosporia rhizophila]MCE0534377.1 SAM-dependent methyltransferase [Kineosporia rhizophila]
MASESGMDDRLPSGARWSHLLASDTAQVLERYRQALQLLSESKYPYIAAIFDDVSSSVRRPATLMALLEGIERFEWFRVKQEGLGDLYEGLLERNATEKRSGAGQYFTPRTIIDSMVRVTQPSPKDVIQDPALGTAGFLISAARYIVAKHGRSLSTAQLSKIFERSFTGMEHVHDTYRLALMNMFLHGFTTPEGIPGVRYGDTLSEGQSLPAASLILSNPPFGTKRGAGLPARQDLPYPTSNKQLCFLQHIYLGLRDGGRAAVVVPDNVLFEDGIGKLVRQDLMNQCSLHTILRLPPGIFYAASVKTNVLFFTKSKGASKGTSETWYYDLRGALNGRVKQRNLHRDQLQDFEILFGSDPWVSEKALNLRREVGETASFRRVDRQEIHANDDNLNIAFPEVDGQGDAEPFQDPVTALRQIIKDLNNLTDSLGQLAENVERTS